MNDKRVSKLDRRSISKPIPSSDENQKPGLGNPITTMRRTGFGNLPTELVQRVIFFLDSDQTPSVQNLLHEPSSSVVSSGNQPLKCFSQTCHSLRSLVMTSLFRFINLRISIANDYTADVVIQSLLEFVAKYRLHVCSVAIWFLLDEAVTIETVPKGFAGLICSRIIRALDLETLTVIARPLLFPYLIRNGRWNQQRQDDTWAFDIPLQILSCSRSSMEQFSETSDRSARLCTTWEGPWSSVTLNEGASVKIYSCYEYYLKTTPSMFTYEAAFLPHIQQHWSTSLRNFTFIAIFPLSNHMDTVYQKLRFLDNLESFTVQFTPSEASDILSDTERIGKCQMSDLWMEFRECLVYTLEFALEMSIVRKLSTLTFLDWYRYDTAAMLMPHCESTLSGWTSNNGCWKKPER